MRVGTAEFGGGTPADFRGGDDGSAACVCWENNGCGGYARGWDGDGNVANSVCISVTRDARPPKEDDIVLNSTCFKEGAADSAGASSM